MTKIKSLHEINMNDYPMSAWIGDNYHPSAMKPSARQEVVEPMIAAHI